jgi:hypothetical protein
MPAAHLPGNPPIAAGLAAKLQAALAASGPGYFPRTRHLSAGMPKYTNRLILEASPYLLQHAHNPVNWYPWGDEAFADADRLRRPVFLSVGYSTCHWCHVMELESFEDEEIAAFLNQNFVSIKVDREERPDVDDLYMTALVALTGSGGWPMSIFLTPEREPFFAGTYFPPRDREGRPGLLTVLRELRAAYDDDPARVRQSAHALSAAIREEVEMPEPAVERPMPGAEIILATVEFCRHAFDRDQGGLRRAPKFPSSLPIRLLLRVHRRTGDADVLRMATRTLEKMAAGGLYDQIGGGFHRYSTDERWLVPHFEKMLYDQGLLALAYGEAFQVTGRPLFGRVMQETLDYLLRDMSAPEGCFYSASDADSEGEEGRHFVWTVEEIRKVLGAEATRFMRAYGVTPGGNFEGRNILRLQVLDDDEISALAPARAKLLEARGGRVRPHRDEKIIASWNGLAISALAFAGRVLNSQRYTAAAARAAEFVLNTMGRDGRILRSHKDGRSQSQGFLEDQAFVAAGLLDLYEATLARRWLEKAISISENLERHFGDTQGGGWFMTAADAETMIAREKPNHDGSEPSGTSVAILTALRLAELTGNQEWRTIAERALAAHHGVMTRRALAMTEALLAVDFYTDSPLDVVLVWPGDQPPTAAEPLLSVLRSTFLPNRALAVGAEGALDARLGDLVPMVKGKFAEAGRTTAYVCERGHCQAPVTDAGQLRRLLTRGVDYNLQARGKST